MQDRIEADRWDETTWGRCMQCERWFYIPRQMSDQTCPACGAEPDQVRQERPEHPDLSEA